MLRGILLSVLVFFSALIGSQTYASHERVMPIGFDRVVVWPWNLAQPFPWADISGLWKAEDGEFTSYFAFKVICNEPHCIRQLQVKQYDGSTCRPIAMGVGIERNQKVLAQMTSKSGMIYRVHLTAFKEQDSPLPPLRGEIPTHGVMVLSMGEFNIGSVEDMYHMQIKKISTSQEQRFCIEDTKR